MVRVFGRRARTSNDASPATDAGHSTEAGLRAVRDGEHPSAALRPTPSAAGTAVVVLNNRYEVGRLLGTGGTATVHAAHDRLLGREVAVKLFRRTVTAAPDLRLQELEARVAGSLSHPALTTLLDAGVETSIEGAPQIYLVMEYVRGASLRERLRQGPLEVLEACWLGFDLADGLDAMHRTGFLHRDVKPANILLSDQRTVRPISGKLTDFGIAAPIGEPDLSEYTTGTAAYLSPEQVEGHDARPESDTYSLALVLIEALTGEVVFPGTVEVSAFARLERDPTIPDTVPHAVAALLTRMTTRNPARRITLFEVAVELQQFLADDLIRRRSTPEERSIPIDATQPVTTQQQNVLESTPDEVFTKLARLAARALNAPKVVLALEEADRMWVKAQHGWDAHDLAPQLTTAPGLSPLLMQPWAIPDTLQHPSVRVDPLLAGSADTRAAAGVPLITKTGHRLGMIAVFDATPRTFDKDELDALTDIADLALHHIELLAAVRRALRAK